jgi:hypothetical protein
MMITQTRIASRLQVALRIQALGELRGLEWVRREGEALAAKAARDLALSAEAKEVAKPVSDEGRA